MRDKLATFFERLGLALGLAALLCFALRCSPPPPVQITPSAQPTPHQVERKLFVTWPWGTALEAAPAPPPGHAGIGHPISIEWYLARPGHQLPDDPDHVGFTYHIYLNRPGTWYLRMIARYAHEAPDGGGLYSCVDLVTIQVGQPPPEIFNDGFETGDTSAWGDAATEGDDDGRHPATPPGLRGEREQPLRAARAAPRDHRGA